MNTIEEIQKLKALLDQGAITKEEYNTLSKKLEPEKNEKEEEPKEEVVTEPNFQPDSELNIISNLNRLPENVVTAGESIQSAVGFQEASFICNLVGTVLLIVSSSSMLPSIMNGRSWDTILGDSPAFIIALILFLLAFIFWVISLAKFDKAGAFLRRSEAIYYGRNTIKVEPSRTKFESNGLKIGQEFAGGIIAYFDETGRYVGIVSKEDLPVKMNLKQALAACRRYNMEGYTDWFMPDRYELSIVFQKLHSKQVGNFKNEKYWFKKTIHDINIGNIVDFKNNTQSFSKDINTDLNLVRPMRLIRIMKINNYNFNNL